MSEVRIVLLGKTGEGKSKTGNTILGREVFESRLSASSVTKACEVASSLRCGKTVTVIDTPGYSDTQLSEQEIRAEVIKSVHLSAPGPHVFILVVRPERFTMEEQRAIRLSKEYFGDSMINRLIVLFAKRDQLDHEGISLAQFLSTAPLQTLIRECGNRYLAFNNKACQTELDSQTQQLMAVIDSLLSQCENMHYSPKLLEDAEREKQKQDELKKKQEEERQRLERETLVAEEKRKVEEESRRQQEANERRIRELEAEKARLAAVSLQPPPPQPMPQKVKSTASSPQPIPHQSTTQNKLSHQMHSNSILNRMHKTNNPVFQQMNQNFARDQLHKTNNPFFQQMNKNSVRDQMFKSKNPFFR